MVFKQGIMKEEKIKFLISEIAISIPLLFLLIIAIVINIIELFMILLLFFILPVFVLSVLLGLKNLEWFYIYEDRIESRNVYGLKNVVYTKNILFIEEVTIGITSRGTYRAFYIFNDSRKNNNNLLNVNSCYNKKKYNLRIYKTDKLEEYINSNNIQIKKENEN